MHPISIALMISLSTAAQTGGIKPEDWKRVTSRAGGFSVMVPGQVEQKVLRQKTDDGLVDSQMIVARAGEVTYLAYVTESKEAITPDKQAAFFDGIKKSYATSQGRTLKREQRGGTLRGMPICFFNVTSVGPDGQARNEQSRFLIGDPTHLISMQVVIPRGVEVNDDVRRFFNSLEYDPAAARAATAGAAAAAAKPAGPAPKPVAAKCRSFSPAGRGFAVQLPGEPKARHQDLAEGAIGFDSYDVDLGDRAFSVGVYSNPPEIAAKPAGENLENVCRGLVGASKGTLGAIKPAPKHGLEGRDVAFSLNNPDTGELGDGRIRAFADGPRLYVLLYAGSKGSGDGAEASRFLDSFRPASAKAK